MHATIRGISLLTLSLILASCVGAPSAPGLADATTTPVAPKPAGSQAALAQATELEGAWVLTELVGTPTLAAPGFEAPTLVFGSSYGEVGGSGGCNSYGARYTLDGEGGLSFGDFWSTKMFCIDAPAETAYFAMLSRARRLMSTERRLALLAEDGALLAVFERSKP